MQDNHGNIWIGTNGGGVSMYKGESFAHFTEKDGLSGTRVYSISEDSHGNIWFGTRFGGVSMYDGGTFTYFTTNEGINHIVNSILEDSRGNLWFGSWGGGVSMYNGEAFTDFTQTGGLSNKWINAIVEDSRGNLWFGKARGVSKYDGETITHYTEKEGLSNNSVWSILEDRRGNLWFGTSGGASMFDGESFTHFTEKEGLGNNIVRSIVEDRDGNIWLGTGKGLNRLVYGPDSVKDTYNNPVIQTYGQLDGMSGSDFFERSVLLDSKNRIWWGSLKGLSMLDMNNFKIPVEPPATMQLNRLDINGQFADYRNLNDRDTTKIKFNGVARYFNYPFNLELPHNLNHLTFHFSAIDWSAPHKLRYNYKMEGLDDDWSIPTAEAKADYRSLPYGTYTFKVKAFGAAQKWSETFEYTFTINPPWWFTRWAYTLYAVSVLMLIFFVFRWRTAKLKQRQRELEQKVKERTTEIRDKNEELRQQQEELQVQKEELQHQKEELQVTLENLKTTQSQLVQSEKMASIGQLVAGIAHEINNPVTFISAGVDSLNTNLEEVRQVLDIYHRITLDNVEEKLREIEKLKEKVEYNEAIREINKLIDSVRTGTQRTTEIVKGLRTFSRLDEDVLKIADIHEGLDSTLILLRNKYKQRIEIIKNYGEIPEIECYPGQLNQVLMNILSNAIEDKGTIRISSSKSNGSIRVTIKDSGKGIPENIQSKIFEPFFTTKEVGQGTGLGLSICQGIIEKHHGSIEVKSQVGKGSEFVIVVPVKQ
jgi:signal transduction histidine kinase/sugar lactone lactonase YvrE